jgi:UDP-N-acetylmuramoyl-tripeptide--D-alanyl-D-alanine ligase
MRKIKSFVSWWVVRELPAVHYKDKVNFLKKWLIHPVKRRLARWYLILLQKFTNIKVIGITGSAGKTTTKEMIGSIFGESAKTIFSKENIDPVYNIPSTILRTPPGTRYLILEMGIEYPGEMDFYLWLAKPDVGVITNIFPTHTEFLGSIEGVLKEKSKLLKALPEDGTAVLNSSDRLLKGLSDNLKSKIVWFQGNLNPFIQNENAARAVAKVFKIKDSDVKKGLSEYKNPPHRLEIIKHPSGTVILDDSYNSNPWAAITTLNYFNSLAKGKKIAVLGDMLELGKFDEEGHRLLGREVAKSGFSAVIGVGKSSAFLLDEVRKESKSTETFIYTDPMSALPVVRSFLGKNTFILVKGSRSIGLDKIIEKLS